MANVMIYNCKSLDNSDDYNNGSHSYVTKCQHVRIKFDYRVFNFVAYHNYYDLFNPQL